MAVVIKSAQRRWFKQADWLYVLLVGMFGSVIGLYYQDSYLVYIGIGVAVLYAILDKWLLKRWQKDGSTKEFS